ncbi:hypothetical protein [Rhizobium leguminosarum]|uniref:hypothetical protein n=1 Tax=Rhizobium leguminosarum TaxID=384 RepID=UPI0014421B40|nr:hypothetical protein [Rhizobium leguminosarum]
MQAMTSEQIDALDAYIFGPDHIPAWSPKIGAWNPTLPAIFPTRKNARRSVLTRLPLMRHGLMHFDIDPDVEAITAFPFQTEYWSATSDGDAIKLVHIPDTAIRMRSGAVICVDYVPVTIQAEKPWFLAKTEQLVVHYENRFGWAYAVHDEPRVYAQPMFSNAQLLWRYLPAVADHAALPTVRRAVMDIAMPAAVASIVAGLTASNPDVAELGPDAEAFVFTAVMQLITEGRLTVDLSLPITTSTVVTKGAAR